MDQGRSRVPRTIVPMTPTSASLMAQVIPALLVAGLLGPLLLGFRVEWPERFYFASQVIVVVIAEGACLYYSVKNEDMNPIWAALVGLATFHLLSGIVFSVLVWARKTDKEKAQLAESRASKEKRDRGRRAPRRG
ncbi:UNVERIFIED_CONTAM: hypothetical protein ABIE34_003923 [Jeotgalibacillus campisalis]